MPPAISRLWVQFQAPALSLELSCCMGFSLKAGERVNERQACNTLAVH